jgi:hypothetical protein
MTPGTIMHLTKAITTKSGGCIVSYKLSRNAFVKVLVLDGRGQTEAEQIAMIDAAAETAKQNIHLMFATKG